MLKVCVIGMGNIGNLHARIYKMTEGVELAGVCDIDRARAREAGANHETACFFDVQEMLDRVKPDLVSVTTGGYEYSSDHYLPTMQALRAGCHVLGEKPISNDIGHAREMVALAEEKGVCYAINKNHRFTPAARAAKQWQREGRLGDILFCNMALWIGKPGEFESPYYHLKALNPHSVDIMRHFCGDVKRVQCFATKAPGRNIWSTASINMLFESGAVGHLTSSYDIARGHPMERCEVAGTNGRLVVDDMWREAALYPAGNPVKTVYTNPVFGGFRDFDDTFIDRIQSFILEIRQGVRPEAIDGSGRDGLKASEVIHAAIKSLDEGRIVDVAEV